MKQKTPLLEAIEKINSLAMDDKTIRQCLFILTKLLPKEKEVITKSFIAGDKTDCFVEENIHEFATDYFNETFTQK